MIEEILLTGLITALSVTISTYAVTKRMEKRVKNYITSEEFLQNIGEIGELFAQGFSNGFQLGNKNLKMPTVNLFGIKIPAAMLYGLIQKSGLLPKGPEESL